MLCPDGCFIKPTCKGQSGSEMKFAPGRKSSRDSTNANTVFSLQMRFILRLGSLGEHGRIKLFVLPCDDVPIEIRSEFATCSAEGLQAVWRFQQFQRGASDLFGAEINQGTIALFMNQAWINAVLAADGDHRKTARIGFEQRNASAALFRRRSHKDAGGLEPCNHKIGRAHV